MERRDFIYALSLLPLTTAAMKLEDLKALTDSFSKTEKLPVFFIGHGSPMNAIEDNPFTKSLKVMGQSVKVRPNAILVVSAHWLTRDTYVSINPSPDTIYDFGGFPDELYRIKYPAKGSPAYAAEVRKLVPEIKTDSDWGLDHGAWTVLKHMFPQADIPVFQLSIDYYKPMQYHFDLALRLKKLREKGVLIIGSGNIVHNLQMFFSKRDNLPFDWNIEFDEWVKSRIVSRDFDSLIHYEKKGNAARLSVPTVDHYVPMIYSLALADPADDIRFTYEETISSVSMRAFRIG